MEQKEKVKEILKGKKEEKEEQPKDLESSKVKPKEKSKETPDLKKIQEENALLYEYVAKQKDVIEKLSELQEIERLKDNGTFRIELLDQLTQLNKTLEDISKSLTGKKIKE